MPRRMKIEADTDDIVELVRGAFEPVETKPSPIPTTLNYPENVPEMPQGQYGTRPAEPPQEDALSRLRQLYETVPTTENQKPSKLRRFGAALAGGLTGAAGGPEVGMKVAGNILEAPYREAYQDWLTKSGALKDQAELELRQQQVESGGLGSLASYMRALQAGDPELQGQIERSRYGAREEALQPGREALETQRQSGRTALEDIRKERETALENLRQGGRVALESQRQGGRATLTDKQIASREKIAREQILSRENIARMNAELRRQLASTAVRNQRVPPSQQYLGRVMAENEIAQIISDPTEFDALFNETTDSSGRVTYQLKPDREVPAAWKKKRDQRVKEINQLLGELIKSSYNPSQETTEDEEDQYEFEEMEE